jgi:pilus assembly protein CpaF
MTPVEPHLLDAVRRRLAQTGGEPSAAKVAEALRRSGGLVGDALVLDVVDTLRRDTVGAGPLDPLLSRDGVTDVLVNGSSEVYVDTGRGLELTGVSFPDDDSVRRLAQRLASSVGRRLDDAVPHVDVRLPDGTRLHAVLAPVARPGTCLSLRVPARTVVTLDDLVAVGSMNTATASLLLDVVASRLAFLVSGGTGSGKTTLLAALLSAVRPSERLVIVEDASELRPRHPHAVALEARQPNVEGVGEVPLRQLVREALRMRPDRLVVGEVRGAEVVDMLAALNTGHEGGCSTIHANSADDVPARFEALGIAAGMPRAAVHAQLAPAFKVVVHLRRGADGIRRLVEIAVLERTSDGFVTAQPALRFAADLSATAGPAATALTALMHERSGG